MEEISQHFLTNGKPMINPPFGDGLLLAPHYTWCMDIQRGPTSLKYEYSHMMLLSCVLGDEHMSQND